MSNPLIVTDKSPKHLLAIQRYVMNSSRYIGGVDKGLYQQLNPMFAAVSGNAYPADPTLAIVGSWEDGVILSKTPRTNSAIMSSIHGWSNSFGASTAPDSGPPGGCTITASAGFGPHFWQASRSGYGVLSVYLRRGTTRYAGVYAEWLSLAGVVVDLDLGVVAASRSATASVTPVPGGGWLVVMTAALGNIAVGPLRAASLSDWTADGSETVWAGGLQVGTSGRLIPTSGSPVTETDVVWDQSTGRAVLARQLDPSAIMASNGQNASMVSPTIWQAPTLFDAFTAGPIRDDGTSLVIFTNEIPEDLVLTWSNAPSGGTMARVDAHTYILTQMPGVQTLVDADLNAIIDANEMLELRGELTVYNDLTINGKLYITQELGF